MRLRLQALDYAGRDSRTGREVNLQPSLAAIMRVGDPKRETRVTTNLFHRQPQSTAG